MTNEPMFYNTHPFKGDADQCEHIVNDWVGKCGCKRENEIHKGEICFFCASFFTVRGEHKKDCPANGRVPKKV